MDPLSIAASALTVIQVVVVVSKSLEDIRAQLRNASTTLSNLANEIADVRLLLDACESALRKWHQSSSQKSLPLSFTKSVEILDFIHDKVNELDALVKRCYERSGSAQTEFSKWRWLRERSNVKKIQESLRDSKRDLMLLLEVHNLAGLVNMQMDFQELVVSSDNLLLSTSRGTDEILENLFLQGEKLDALEASNRQLAQLISGTQSSDKPTNTYHQDPRSSSDGGSIRIQASCYRRSCRPWCSCRCHIRGNLKSPAMVSRFFGSLFVSYSGVPGLSQTCDEKHCHSRTNLRIITSYQLPTWIKERVLYTCFVSSRMTGPEFLVRVQNSVPFSSETYQHCLNGDSALLKRRFDSGLASPYDVDPDGLSLLHNSLRWNQLGVCSLLISYGANLYQEDHSGLSAFHYAWDKILEGPDDADLNQRLLEIFPQEEGGLDERQFTRLHKCVLGLIGTSLAQELEISTALLDAPDNLGKSPLFWASRRGDATAVRLLLENKADANFIRKSANPGPNTPLQAAALSGNSQCVELLVRGGAHIETADSWGLRALHHAASANDGNGSLENLLGAGANIDAQDNEGRTALLMAAQNGMLSNAALILKHGASMELSENEGWTPLLSCLFWNMHDSIRWLLHNGASLSARTGDGDTVLHVAAQYGDVATIDILLEALSNDCHRIDGLIGQGDQLTNTAGQTPGQIAAARHETQVDVYWLQKFQGLDEFVLYLLGQISEKSSPVIIEDTGLPIVSSLTLTMEEKRGYIHRVDISALDDGKSIYEDAVETFEIIN